MKKAFLVDGKTARKWHLEKSKLRQALTGGKQVKRYYIDRPDIWLIYTRATDNFGELRNVRAYIDQFRDEITCKEVEQNKHPLYSLHRPRDERIFLKDEKVLGVITEDKIVVALDTNQTFATDGLYLFSVRKKINPKYLMAILNSRLLVFVYRLLTLEKGRVLAQVKPTTLCELPIHSINLSDPADVARHDRMVALVEQMLELHKRQAAAKSQSDQELYQRQIDATDREIDRLVYELYGLTPDEIAIVEGQ